MLGDTRRISKADFLVCILAGGESQRMGQDKAQIRWHGMSLLEHIAQTAQCVTPQVLVVGRLCPPDWPMPDTLFLPDSVRGEGPLRGLETALQVADGKSVVLLACDMPLLDTGALSWLMSKATNRPLANGLVTTNAGQWEPLFSVYTPACLSRVQQRLHAQRRSLQGMIAAGQFDFVEAPPAIAACLRNVNTPADLDTLSQTAERP